MKAEKKNEFLAFSPALAKRCGLAKKEIPRHCAPMGSKSKNKDAPPGPGKSSVFSALAAACLLAGYAMLPGGEAAVELSHRPLPQSKLGLPSVSKKNVELPKAPVPVAEKNTQGPERAASAPYCLTQTMGGALGYLASAQKQSPSEVAGYVAAVRAFTMAMACQSPQNAQELRAAMEFSSRWDSSRQSSAVLQWQQESGAWADLRRKVGENPVCDAYAKAVDCDKDHSSCSGLLAVDLSGPATQLAASQVGIYNAQWRAINDLEEPIERVKGWLGVLGSPLPERCGARLWTRTMMPELYPAFEL